MADLNISKLLYFDKDKLVVSVIPDGKTIPDIFNVIETITIEDNLYIYIAELKTNNSYNQFINECEDFTLERINFTLYMNVYTTKHFNINQFNRFINLINKNKECLITVNELHSGINSGIVSLFTITDKYYQFVLDCSTPQKLAIMYMLVRFYIENKNCILEKTSYYSDINNFIGYDIFPRTNILNFKITNSNGDSSILPNYSMYANNLNCIFNNTLYKHVFNMNTIQYNKQLNIENNTYTDNRCNIQCNIFNFLTYELCMINMYNDELLEEHIKIETDKNIKFIQEYLIDLIIIDFDLNNFTTTELCRDKLSIEEENKLINDIKLIAYYKLINSKDNRILINNEIDFCDNDIIIEKLKNISSIAEFINTKLTTEMINENIIDILNITIKYELNKLEEQQIKLDKCENDDELYLKVITINKIFSIIIDNFYNELEKLEIIKIINLIDIIENYKNINNEYLESLLFSLYDIQLKKKNNIILTDEELFVNILNKLYSYKNIKYKINEPDNKEINKLTNENNQDGEYTLINNDSSVNLAKLALQDGNISDDISSSSGIIGSLTGWLFKS